MRTSSATKRRRRKERRFRDLFDVLSSRMATVAAIAAVGFVMLQVGRIYLQTPVATAPVERVSAAWADGRTEIAR